MLPQEKSCALLLVDAPNVCGVYGHVLGRKPTPADWPRWNRLLDNVDNLYGTVDAHYVIDGNRVQDRLWPFLRQLKQFGYDIDAPKGYPSGGDGDPVDDLIRSRIDLASPKSESGYDRVIVVAHDRGYAPHLQRFFDRGGAVTIIGFREWLAPALLGFERSGADMLDIEHDLGGFDFRLDRPYSPDLRIVP